MTNAGSNFGLDAAVSGILAAEQDRCRLVREAFLHVQKEAELRPSPEGLPKLRTTLSHLKPVKAYAKPVVKGSWIKDLEVEFKHWLGHGPGIGTGTPGTHCHDKKFLWGIIGTVFVVATAIGLVHAFKHHPSETRASTEAAATMKMEPLKQKSSYLSIADESCRRLPNSAVFEKQLNPWELH